MLKVECPECKEWIHSPLLMEMDKTTCPGCGVQVPVDEVYITAGPYSISRDVLMKHFFKYKRLLTEAANELEEMKKEGKGLKTYEVSSDSVNKFMGNLQELLTGCRSGFRITPGDKKVNYFVKDNSNSNESRLVNISMTGICIDAAEGSVMPRKGEEITIELVDEQYSIKVKGMVVRSGKDSTIGIQFLGLDDNTRKGLLDYILEKGS